MHGTLRPSVNSATVAMLLANLGNAQNLGLSVEQIGAATVVQFSGPSAAAIDHEASVNAGILLAKVCLGGRGEVSVVESVATQISRPHVSVSTAHPLVDCIGCQYAGWPLSEGGYSAMASGPIRLMRGCEAVLQKYGLSQTDSQALIVLESSKLPCEQTIQSIARQAGVAAEDLFICIAKTSSLPGTLQVVARSVETAMHKLYELGFDLATIRSGQGTAPLPPTSDSDLIAMGWTNDAILYGASVELTVDMSDQAIAAIIDQVPASSSEQFGKPFLSIFNEAGRDFYKIDPLLFAPAKIMIKNQRTGNSFSAGQLHTDILQASFEI